MTLAETTKTNGLITEPTLWAASDLIVACGDWIEERPTEWLEAWDRMPFAEMIMSVDKLRGVIPQRYALGGMIYRWLTDEITDDDDLYVPRIKLGKLDYAQRVELGRRLLEAKRHLPQGHFGPWLQSRQDIGQETARACMRLAREADQEVKANRSAA